MTGLGGIIRSAEVRLCAMVMEECEVLKAVHFERKELRGAQASRHSYGA